MYLKRKAARFTGILMSLAFIVTTSSSTLAETKQELQSQLDAKNKNIEELDGQIQANEAQQSSILSEIEEVDKRYVTAKAEAERLGGELDKTIVQREEAERQLALVQAELDKTLKELDEARKRLGRYKKILNDRLKNVYKNGKSTFIKVILQADNFSDLVNRAAYLNFVASQDAKLVKETSETKATIEKKEAEQQRQKNSVEVKKASIVAEEQRIGYLKAEQDRQQAAAQAELNQRETLVVQLEQDRSALEEMQRQEEADARALSAKISSWGSRNVSRTGWVWPTGSTADISSPFGWRVHPIFGDMRFHSGIDIAVDYGTPVYAANNGTVEMAEWYGGYGLFIAINHGDGLASAYAHLSSVAVEVGQQVNAGDVIGYVGSTGNSTGPHLHFEILEDGVQVDPMNYY